VARPKPSGSGKKTSSSQPTNPAPPSAGKQRGKGRRRMLRTAAVVISCPPGQYKEAIRLATEKIDLAGLDINGVTARRAATGAQIFEVGGPDNKRKADVLAERMREVFTDREKIRVSRPSPTAELRVRDLCDAVEEEDVLRAVASAGDCDPNQVKVVPIRSTGRGLGTAWVLCPLATANKLVG